VSIRYQSLPLSKIGSMSSGWRPPLYTSTGHFAPMPQNKLVPSIADCMALHAVIEQNAR
jgi:hypothetical protein